MSQPSTDSVALALQTLGDAINENASSTNARAAHERLAEALPIISRLHADYTALTLPAFGATPSGNQLAIDA